MPPVDGYFPETLSRRLHRPAVVGLLRPRELEIGWRLARSAWGHGYATEAATAALAYGTSVVPRVVSSTAPTNVRSQA